MKIALIDDHPTLVRYKNYLKSFLYDLFLLIISLGITYVLCPFTGRLYSYLANDYGSWIDTSAIIGLFFNYLFFIPLVFIVLGDKNKHWWIITALVLMFLALGYMYYDIGSLWRDIDELFIYALIAISSIILGLGILKIKTLILNDK